MKYKIVALIGEAGSGKDTILQDLLQNSNFNEIISYTTRPPRDGEINGKNYFFISPEEFLDKIQEILYGKGYIEDELCGKRFIITADSFYQINHNQLVQIVN